MKVINLSVENKTKNIVTDEARPRFSFGIRSDGRNVTLKEAIIKAGEWSAFVNEQILIPYGGAPLKPYSDYTLSVSATDSDGNTDRAELVFSTGRMGQPWTAKWITDGEYKFTEKRVSPTPMVFRKRISLKGEVASAKVYSTAMGVYELSLDGKKIGEDYFAPGFTSYKTNLQYQVYDITAEIKDGGEICAVVAGGWAVGSFVFTRKNRITAARQAFLAEIRIVYKDGSVETVGTDETWEVTENGNYRMADLYDGETYDATVDLSAADWRRAKEEKLRVSPAIKAAYGLPVRAHEVMEPVSFTEREDGETIYDFGQNFAGVIRARIKNGKTGQTVIFRHAEILKKDGSLFTELLRSAKATATYVCKQGEQEYSPRFTYMGFRYVGVKGIRPEDIELKAVAVYSDIRRNGSFECSEPLINRLQENILWSSKSNFVDIPTDCPQRDERMGWTGDIAVFAPTACYNFDMSAFLEKWLIDLKNEQLKTGGIPNTVPVQGYGFPATMPVMAVDFWGDACVLVPWAEYLARGDKELLEKNYSVMKKYVDACKFWAGFGIGKRRYIWHTFFMFHFGDWVAPDEPSMAGWQKRSKWTATASLCHTSGLLAEIARILGYDKDEKYYSALSRKVADAYVSVFTDGNGKLKKEFQTAYVLPLAFGMFDEKTAGKAAENLAELVKKNGYRIGTGFPGTPYILFALADNGQADAAMKMLLNTRCPSWLFEVKAGGTTIWERWDALKEDGTSNTGAEDGTGGMISYNHYASGAVGDFLYKRIAGIEAVEAGYKKFRIKPLVLGLTSAKGCVNTPYGEIVSDWKKEGEGFEIHVEVPVGTSCEVVLPSGKTEVIGSGKYDFREQS